MGGIARASLLMLGLTVFAAVVAVSFAYVRLLHGPISLRFATGLIEQTVSADLGGRPVRIEDIEVVFDDAGRLAFSLRNIAIADLDGAPLAIAPRASVALSKTALYRGRLALSRVDLVAPRLQLFYAESGALSLRFSRAVDPVPSPPPSGPNAANAPVSSAQIAAADTRGIDLVRVLADASSRARRREDATAFLRVIGIKQAVVVVDNGQRKSVWNVPDAQIDLDHKRTRSLIAGRATIASLSGPWSLAFNTFEADQSEAVQLAVNIRDLNLHGLARMAPSFAVFDGLDVPLSGDAKLELPISGGIKAASWELSSGAGQARLPFASRAVTKITRSSLTGSYDGATRQLTIGKASFETDDGRLDLAGRVTAAARTARGAAEAWDFDLGSTGGALAGDKRAVPIDLLVARGTMMPTATKLVLREFAYRAGGADIVVNGEIVDLGAAPRAMFDGRIGAMTAAQLKSAWPSALAPLARSWVGAHVTKGQLAAGTFKIATHGGPSRTDPTGETETRLSATLEASGVELALAKGVPPIDLPRALVRIEGQTVEVTAPDAGLTAAEGRKLQLKGVRFTAVETASGDQPTAEIAFRLQGSLAAVADIADREALQLLKSNGIAVSGLDGKLDGALKVTLPLADNVHASEVKVEGRVKASDLRMKQAFGGYDLGGGAVTVDVNDKAMDVRGDLLVRGVNAKLNWQYLFNTPADRQPPLRVTTTLDNSDRSQLGLDVADVVQGETPVEIVASRDARGEFQTRVRADLRKAELTIDAIDWKKAAGRAATLQFDPMKGPGTGAAQRLELQNVKLVGDDIAVEGWMAIGADNKLREMSFPSFSVNVVSRLDIQGKLRPDNVWDIKAKGATFDGRDMFRGLFNVGQTAGRPQPKDKPGLDLVAEVDTVIGFSDATLKAVRLRASRRGDKLTELDLKGTLDGGRPLVATVVALPQGRQLRAEGEDAGQVFKLVGFYPNAIGGAMKLQVDLEGKGAAEKSGVLWAENFAVLGDPIVSEVLQNADGSPSTARSQKRVVRSQFDFDQMRVPFDVGAGQFVMNNAAIKGPLLGATWRGKVDFKQQALLLAGTYAPLSGLNSALGAILGPLSGGVQGEGLLGITFKVEGPLANPQVIANPLSLVTPGIFRDAFSQLAPETFRVTPRADKPAAVRAAAPASSAARASSAPATDKAAPEKAPATTAPAEKAAAKSSVRKTPATDVQTDMQSGWSSETEPKATAKRRP